MTPAGRTCPVPGCPEILTGGERRCPTHRADYERTRGTPRQRGYDATHDRTRATLEPLVTTGQARCVTCGTTLTTWDLGHTEDRTGYLGPQCRPCNRGDGGRRAAHDPATR